MIYFYMFNFLLTEKHLFPKNKSHVIIIIILMEKIKTDANVPIRLTL